MLGSLGAGGMGQVFEARDRELDRKVAVKVLHQHGPATEKAQARLLREAQALAKISVLQGGSQKLFKLTTS